MTSADIHARLKEEAKALRARVEDLVREGDARARMVRTVCIYGGMITETLLEYEEPDAIMEQAFHRISDLAGAEPADGEEASALVPPAYALDHDAEIGRALARALAAKLPKGLDSVHEVAIALIIGALSDWEKEGFARDVALRVLVEAVIDSLTFEIATQEFCDVVIEDFIGKDEKHTTADGIIGIGAVAGHYFGLARQKMVLPPDAETGMMRVVARESLRHGAPGSKDWAGLAVANDSTYNNVPDYIRAIKPGVEDFLRVIGLEDPLGRAVAVGKAVGRLVAAVSVEEVGQIHPSTAKSLAKTGMILGERYKEHAIQ